MTVTEFVLERLPEDWDKARAAVTAAIFATYDRAAVDEDPDWVANIVDSWLDPAGTASMTPALYRECHSDEIDERQIAAYYADHPDYDEACRSS